MFLHLSYFKTGLKTFQKYYPKNVFTKAMDSKLI